MTTALAYSASTRALGGSVAAKVLPVLVTAQAVGTAVNGSVVILSVAALVIWTAITIPRFTGRTPAPETG